MDIQDSAEAQKWSLDSPSVWRATCMALQWECEDSGASGSIGQRGSAEMEPGFTLSIDSKMYSFTMGM